MAPIVEAIVAQLREQENPAAVASMARYGITANVVYGVKMPVLRQLAKDLGHDHDLAEELWAYDSRETRILATLVDRWPWVDEAQMERWVVDFDSWEVCDQACSNLFGRTSYAYTKTMAWSERPEEFVKRAGFVLMTRLTRKTSQVSDEALAAFLPVIEREAHDDRNFVKKAVNWALRDIGKRNLALNAQAIATAEGLMHRLESSAQWIGRDAYKELTSDAVQQRVAEAN